VTAPLSARLGRLHELVAGHVARGEVPGAVTLIGRADEVHVDTLGTTDVEGSQPMRRDTIFRIASLTKPVVAAATMLLVEDGLLQLDEPVDRLVPELADRRVLRRPDSPLDDTVAARRPISVRDLLTLRMGFGYIMSPGEHPIVEAAEERQLGMGPPKPATPHTPDMWLRHFAALPLMHQPGEQWMYELGFAVLGVLIARAAGQPLEAFLRQRLFAPLRMADTGFSVPAQKLHRLAPCYVTADDRDGLVLYDGVDDSQWRHPPVFPDATGGLVSTVDDYLAFARMLLHGGVHGGERILSTRSVEAMTTDQLTPAQHVSASARAFLDDSGWGFGMAVDRDGGVTAARYGWGGGLGTSWYTYPDHGLIAMLMTQRLPPSTALFDDFWEEIEGAVARGLG
jgi:CubicO group peptidase (beta-lactamase class C family)